MENTTLTQVILTYFNSPVGLPGVQSLTPFKVYIEAQQIEVTFDGSFTPPRPYTKRVRIDGLVHRHRMQFSIASESSDLIRVMAEAAKFQNAEWLELRYRIDPSVLSGIPQNQKLEGELVSRISLNEALEGREIKSVNSVKSSQSALKLSSEQSYAMMGCPPLSYYLLEDDISLTKEDVLRYGEVLERAINQHIRPWNERL